MTQHELHKVSTDEDIEEAIRRAFGHYTMERSIAEVVDRPQPRRAPRRALAGRAVAVAVAGAALLVAALLPGRGEDTPLGPGPARAFASWTPKPQPVDSGLLGTAVARCSRADSRGAQLPVAATERRGGYTLVLRTDGTRRAVCIAGPGNQVLSVPAPPRLAASEASPKQPHPFPIEEVVFPGPRNPLAEQVGLVVGRVRADVGAVEIRAHEGLPVTATVSRRYFAAWWPGSADDAAHARITAFGHGRSPLARFALLRGEATLAEFARHPSAFEPVVADTSELTGSDRMPIMTLGTSRHDLGREIVVYLGESESPDGGTRNCREFSTDAEWRAASPSLPPECRYPG